MPICAESQRSPNGQTYTQMCIAVILAPSALPFSLLNSTGGAGGRGGGPAPVAEL